MSESSKAEDVVWAFDLGKGSIGEAVRQGTIFLHKASLLIPADFAETKTAAKRRRMWRTRQAHKAREQWLEEVMSAAGIEVLKGRQIGKVAADGKEIPKDRWNKTKGKWVEICKGDPRLEREFPAPGDDTCYTSCLLRIKLLRGEKLEPWQIYKAFHSAIQRRGYDPHIPWKARESRSLKPKEGDDDEAGTENRMREFENAIQKMAPGKSEFHYPPYFDAWKMGLWSPDKPEELILRSDCHAQTTRRQIVPRKLVEAEIRRLVESAARDYPALAGKADYLLYGPPQKAYASFDPILRKEFELREGGANDWQGVVGQKIPRFDNRIIGKCVLIPRLNVCKVRLGADGELHPQSRVAVETVFLMKLKNMRFHQNGGVRGLTAKEIGEIFNDSKRTKLGLTPTQWKKWCVRFGGQSLPGQYEEVTEPSFSGRSRFCRPALEILKRLLLSGDTPRQAHEKEIAGLNGNTNPLQGLVAADLDFLLKMGQAWEGIYIPNQKLDALARSTGDEHEAIRELIGTQNDPIVRHRLTIFAERLDDLAGRFGPPDSIVLEFVRQDFMGKKAKLEYFKFQRDRASERAKAREEAVLAGAGERSSGLKMELLKAQLGECLYRPQDKLIPERLDEYVIDHIVPRAKGGPDAAVNYVLTTRRTNDEKADRTPYEWLAGKEGWDAYVERLKKRTSTLRNKKVQLLTSPDAEKLVEKYTALAETAWISKLAQTIIGLRFGWPGGIANGERRVIVVSGGLTGRIRRKYKLNSLLNPAAKSEEEAETKNRNDDRHHALDAMVISFIPNWARNSKATGFFRFPDGVHQELFAKEIAEVIPENICFEKSALAETIYGARMERGKKVIVQRTSLLNLAFNTKKQQKVFDLEYAVKQAQNVREPVIRERLLEFYATNPDEGGWRTLCAEFHLKRKDGSKGSRVEFVTVTDAIVLHCDERYQPCGWTAPLARVVDLKAFQNQTARPKRLNERLWHEMLRGKTLNQSRVLQHKQLRSPHLERALREKQIDEANCARRYWQLYFPAIGWSATRRDRKEDTAPNQMLNYGYAVLAALCHRSLIIHGLLPQLGVFHKARYRSDPLVYDLMEAFRPAVELMLAEFMLQPEISMKTWAKKVGTELRERRVRHGDYTLKLMDAIDASANSLARAYEEYSAEPFWVPELPEAAGAAA